MGIGIKCARDAEELATKVNDLSLIASSRHLMTQILMRVQSWEDAFDMVESAIEAARDAEDQRIEANCLVMDAECRLQIGDIDRAKEAAKMGAAMMKKIGDERGEDWAMQVLDVIDDLEKGPQEQEQRPVRKQEVQEAPKQEVQKVPQMPQEMVEVDLTTSQGIRYKLHELIGAIVGNNQQIDDDAQLMQSGLTSISAIMLRDQLADLFPDLGDQLGFTLIFDYPSISSMSDFLLEETLALTNG
eukprot:NODE_15055_length_1071_cov_3.217161.p1 GENE.NODE_15055_length_1071_cov_3.217161~~NODE_15055_length_1071_cov_3.217161.p1  ORF type:complete len:244 (+),score=109.81 NODE_15055_length_1071_cov_3.217161:179-910(+)